MTTASEPGHGNKINELPISHGPLTIMIGNLEGQIVIDDKPIKNKKEMDIRHLDNWALWMAL
jgi:hypothetical protein